MIEHMNNLSLNMFNELVPKIKTIIDNFNDMNRDLNRLNEHDLPRLKLKDINNKFDNISKLNKIKNENDFLSLEETEK